MLKQNDMPELNLLVFKKLDSHIYANAQGKYKQWLYLGQEVKMRKRVRRDFNFIVQTLHIFL